MNDSINHTLAGALNGAAASGPDHGLPGDEALLAGVWRASPLGIGHLVNHRLCAANPKLAEITGRTELIGLHFSELFLSAKEFERVQSHLERELALHPVASIETRWLRADGGRVEIQLNVTATTGGTRNSELGTRDSESGTHYTFTALDITARRDALEEIVLCHQQLAGFHTISEIMQGDEPGIETFNAIAREVSEMTGFPVVAIELCDFQRSVMIYCGSHGVELAGLPEPLEIPMDVTPSGQVALTGETLVETEAAVRRECAAPFFRQMAAETFVCVPIKTNRQVVGALSLAHRRRETVHSRVLLQIESLANYLATLFARLRAREAVRKGEAELAAVYDRAPNVMCLLDEKLRIVQANRAALEFTPRWDAQPNRLSPGAFLNCETLAKNPGSRCGGTEVCTFCELRRAVTETLKTGKGWHQVRITKRVVRANGDEQLTLLISTVRLRLDTSTRVLLCLEDITQNERADEKIRSQAALLDVARDAIIVRDFADKITYWNEGAHRLYGWTAAEAVGRTMSELLLGEDGKVAAEAFRAVQDREDWAGEMQNLTRAGGKLTVQSRWTVVRDRAGVPQGILVVNTDHTEKKRLEAQLLRAQRLESIGTLASGLAHDLNNVLAPIMMSVHMLKEEATSDTMRTCLETLETCAQRGSDIVGQVLLFARGVEGSRVPVHPKHLLTDIQRIVRETFPRSIRVESVIAKQPALVECDATQLQQVLMNLCVNARDAMPQGGTLSLRSEVVKLGDAERGTVNTERGPGSGGHLGGEGVFSLHPKARAGSYVVLSVADTGTGIAPEVMEKIFDPFFTTKPLGHGTGLGLPIVMGIAENHGGFVQVESKVGVGTTFRVYLPTAVSEQEKLVGPRGGADLPQGHGETVLVVDDEPAIRRIVDVILSKNGYRTVVAADGREAVALFHQHKDEIAVVVSDLMMPYQDGPTTIRAIRQVKRAVRVVAITGLGEEVRMAEAKAAGAEVFVKKPFTAGQLLTTMRDLLATPRA